MTLSIPAGMPAPEATAYEAGFMSAEDQWRRAAIAILLTLAGGDRGLAACRRNGKCEREPQRSLEEAIERLTLFSAVTAPDLGRQAPPATKILAILQHLATTPSFTPIHIKRDELNAVLSGVRKLQDTARGGLSHIEHAGKLDYDKLNRAELGTVMTYLASIRGSLEEFLK